MSLLKKIDHYPNFAPKESGPATDRLVSGTPAFKTWLQDSSRGGSVETGIWEATPGEHRSVKGDGFEFCHILQGIVELRDETGKSTIYRAGDSLVMKPGFNGVWHTVETVRKVYVTVK